MDLSRQPANRTAAHPCYIGLVSTTTVRLDDDDEAILAALATPLVLSLFEAEGYRLVQRRDLGFGSAASCVSCPAR